MTKKGKPDTDVSGTLLYLQHLVRPVDEDSWCLESEARERLRGRDEEDWPVLATALALNRAIWTEDADFSESLSLVLRHLQFE